MAPTLEFLGRKIQKYFYFARKMPTTDRTEENLPSLTFFSARTSAFFSESVYFLNSSAQIFERNAVILKSVTRNSNFYNRYFWKIHHLPRFKFSIFFFLFTDQKKITADRPTPAFFPNRVTANKQSIKAGLIDFPLLFQKPWIQWLVFHLQLLLKIQRVTNKRYILEVFKMNSNSQGH